MLTHFDWILHPVHLELDSRPLTVAEHAASGSWVPFGKLSTLGLPAPLRKLLSQRA